MTIQPINLLTYNIHKGFSRRGRYHTAHHIKTEISQLAPDIVCLQEVQGQHLAKRFNAQAKPKDGDIEVLTEQSIWPYYTYARNASYPGGHHGNAILSRYPLAMTENINLAKYARASRSLLHATILPPHMPKTLHIICVHLGLSTKARKQQLDRLCQRIIEHVPPEHALIIAGDFNDWLLHARHLLEQRLSLAEAHDICKGNYARTFPATRPVLHTDRIYYRGLSCNKAQALVGKPWTNLSDHLPLTAQLTW